MNVVPVCVDGVRTQLRSRWLLEAERRKVASHLVPLTLYDLYCERSIILYYLASDCKKSLWSMTVQTLIQ